MTYEPSREKGAKEPFNGRKDHEKAAPRLPHIMALQLKDDRSPTIYSSSSLDDTRPLILGWGLTRSLGRSGPQKTSLSQKFIFLENEVFNHCDRG